MLLEKFAACTETAGGRFAPLKWCSEAIALEMWWHEPTPRKTHPIRAQTGLFRTDTIRADLVLVHIINIKPNPLYSNPKAICAYKQNTRAYDFALRSLNYPTPYRTTCPAPNYRAGMWYGLLE